jgi:diguanylate cyclase (GGDEF)-like protein
MTEHNRLTGAELSAAAVNVLLVEDNVDQRELTVAALAENMPQARVTDAENGPTALGIIENAPTDVVILDYSLPGMNGLEVLSEINRIRPNTPVIMVTGQGDETVAVDAMKNGAQDYVIKISNYHEALPTIIQRTLRQTRLKKDLDEASLRGRRLYELSLAATKERKVDTLTERLVEGAAQLIGVEMSILFLMDSSGDVAFVKSHGVEINETELTGPLDRIGLLSSAYTANRPIVVEDPRTHPLWDAAPWMHPFMRQMLSVPLTMQDNTEGVLCLINKRNRLPYSPEDVDTLSTLAVHAGVAIDNARFMEKIEQQAVRDSLTGLYNHMEFQNHLAKEVARCRRYGGDFSLLMLDLDHFKLVNDSYGHQTGDAVLKEIVRTIQHRLRSVDKVFRYGGEEFAVVLPETQKDGAKIISERIRKAVEESVYELNSSHSIKVTVSIGVSTFPHDAANREETITTADQALFSAKRTGRNRVVVYSDGLGNKQDLNQIRLEDYLCDPQMMVLRDLAAINNAQWRYVDRHSEGVSKYALQLADSLKLSDLDKKNLEFASLLHNIGDIGIPDDLLNKEGPVSEGERAVINAHPTLAQMLIRQTDQLVSGLQTILHQHERYDGHGYPAGLKGEDIPYLSRLLGVVVAYDAMMSIHSPALSMGQAIEVLRKSAGTRFDPIITERFIALLEGERVSIADLV